MLYLDLSCRQRNAENRFQTHQELTDAIVEGTVQRIRPKLMTGITTLIGLNPHPMAERNRSRCDETDSCTDGRRHRFDFNRSINRISGNLFQLEGLESQISDSDNAV